MKVAIIGATSFIGQNLIKYFLKKKITIVCTFNKNLKIKKKITNVVWKKLDLSKNKKNYFKYLGSPDVLINLSWPNIPNYTTKNHLKTSYYQKRLNKNLIFNGLNNIIFLGTCFEYGDKKGSISERSRANPKIPYSIAKLKVLKNLIKLKKNYKFKLSWLRPFYVYGNNKKRETLYTIINDLKKVGGKLKLDGSLIRDFVPLEFLCKTIVKIALMNKDFGIINVCTGKGVSIKDFIKKNIKNKKNLKKINMNGKASLNFEPKKFWGNPNKLKKILNIKNN
ncbi:NAD(P)-dependent oxidoreductase [Candidatus Pelagibacter sp.]|nr:NAD(P)-dependent oxidoreductase [Candidatus Pelagibacter sp.]